MKQYTYQFLQVPIEKNFRAKAGDSMEACRQTILQEAEKGWRLKQVLLPANEKTGVYTPLHYELIFEKEITP